MAANGTPGPLLQAYMGHATITTATIYTRLAIRYEVEARHWTRGQIQLLEGQTCALPKRPTA